MNSIHPKKEGEDFFLWNTENQPEIVLIMPITRSQASSHKTWQSAINFVRDSKIKSFIVVDKTPDASASRYFMNNFDLSDRDLYILPRSINESHYESLGSIKLDHNLWVMQLHDDDTWNGRIILPNSIEPKTAFFSKFFVKSDSKKYLEKLDFKTPGRANFILIPSNTWNQFVLLIHDQKFHVAGSLDAVLNQMVHLTCKLIPISGFCYYYDNHNWANKVSSRRSLKKLSKKDGWGSWVSVDVALLNRLLDNLSSLWYVEESAHLHETKVIFKSLMQQFRPSLRRRILIRSEISALELSAMLSFLFPIPVNGIRLRKYFESKLTQAKFIRESWEVKSISDTIRLVEELENMNQFRVLQDRFNFWKMALANLTRMFED